MKQPLVALRLCTVVLVLTISLAQVCLAAAQGAPPVGEERIQRITACLEPGEIDAHLLKDLLSAVDSPNENFTVLGSLRMDWTDHALAFSPDTCNCSVKVYTDKDVDRLVAEAQSRWPAFTFFNQLGNRWIQSRTASS